MGLTFSSLSLKNVGLYPCCQRRPSSFHLCLNLLSNSISHFFHFRTLVFNFMNRWLWSLCYKCWRFRSIEWIFRTHCSSCYLLWPFKVFGPNWVSRFNLDLIMGTFPSVALYSVLHHGTFTSGGLQLNVFLRHHVLGGVFFSENLVSGIVEEISIWCSCLDKSSGMRCCWSCKNNWILTSYHGCSSGQRRASTFVSIHANLEALCSLYSTCSPCFGFLILYHFFRYINNSCILSNTLDLVKVLTWSAHGPIRNKLSGWGVSLTTSWCHPVLILHMNYWIWSTWCFTMAFSTKLRQWCTLIRFQVSLRMNASQ